METPETKAKLTDGPDAFGPAWKAETMRYSKVELVELYKLALLLLLPVRQDRDDALEILRHIHEMPEHDQDDAHRLRDKAHRGIELIEGRGN